MISIGEILNDKEEQERRMLENHSNNMRVAIPGYIVDFNSSTQTATIQPTIKERLKGTQVDLPKLLDVPVQFPKAGGYSITFPVKTGDECLVIFSDMCIDAWYQSGGIQPQLESRRHDLSDGIAILGISSLPNTIKSFSNEGLQLRDESGNTYIQVTDNKISMKATSIDIQGNVNVKGNISANDAILGGKSFLSHTNGGYSID